MKAIKYIALLFSLLSAVSLYGQGGTGAPVPNIVPKSSEVMGLERYGEYPVSEYTGIPSINIPLYTIKVKDFEFPISLDYNASGIQVAQEATWVGLGWNLLAGGCISVSAVGAIDGLLQSSNLNNGLLAFASATDWAGMLSYSTSYRQASGMPDGIPSPFPVVSLSPTMTLSQFDQACNDPNGKEFKVTKEASMGNGERDIYNVSFLGQSFKFSIHPTTGAIVYNGEKNKYKIEKQGNDTWVITDEFGYQYKFFGEANNVDDREMIYFSGQYTKPQVSWFLSQITYQGNELVKINYNKNTSIQVQKLPTISESCNYLNGVKWNTYKFGTYTESYHPLYLSSIITPLDSIVFTTGSRDDMTGALKLQEMKVMDRSSKTLRKKYEFQYNYFTGNNDGMGNMINIPARVSKRLKLTEIIQWENGTSGKSMKYALTYDESTSLPCKTSFSQDLWGYYNGYSNSCQEAFTKLNYPSDLYSSTSTLLPTTDFLKYGESVASCLLNFTGAHREANKNVITAGMLKSITYPTGGKTVFEFEPNEFSSIVYSASLSAPSGSCQIGNNGYPSFYPGAQMRQFEVETLTKNANVEVTIIGKNYDVSKMDEFYVTLTVAAGSASSKAYKYAITTDAQKTQFNQNKIVTIKDQVDLPVGRVTFSTHIDPNLPNPYNYLLENGVVGSLVYSSSATTGSSTGTAEEIVSIGGGLRIKKITNYTDNNTIASVKRYKYVTKDGNSSGKLIHPMKFTDQRFTKEKIQPGTDYNLFDRINSSNVWNYSTSGSEAIVGYSRVEVENLSADEKTGTGKNIVEFKNVDEINAYPSLSIFIPSNKATSILNGKLASSTVLDGNNNTVSEEKYTYSVENIVRDFINIRQMEWLATTPFIDAQHIIPVLMAYPTTNYTTYLTKKEENAYFGTNKINKITDFEYDPSNYKVKKMTETLDNNKTKITEYKYGLSANNMVSVLTQESVSMNSTPVQVKTMNYNTSINSGFGLALTNISIKNGSYATDTLLKYENYDKFGNPLYITKDNATKVVYIWGYNYQYPIAEIKNCTYSQLTGVISAGDLDNIAKKLAPAAADTTIINGLRDKAALKDAHVTTFWYKPMVGLIQVQDPSKRNIYFEYDTFNRLINKYDGTKKITESYDYYIKQ